MSARYRPYWEQTLPTERCKPRQGQQDYSRVSTVGGSLGAQDSGVSIVTSQIVPGKLTEGVLFNAPQPNIQDYALGKNLAIPNSRGFLVSDPVWRSQVRDIKSTWASWNDNYGFRFSLQPGDSPRAIHHGHGERPYPRGEVSSSEGVPSRSRHGRNDVPQPHAVPGRRPPTCWHGSDYEKYYNGITSEQRDNIWPTEPRPTSNTCSDSATGLP